MEALIDTFNRWFLGDGESRGAAQRPNTPTPGAVLKPTPGLSIDQQTELILYKLQLIAEKQ